MTKSYRNKRKKQGLMLYFLKVCQSCSDKGHFRSAMDRRKKIMGHIVVVFMVVTGQIEMTQLKMIGCWIIQIGELRHTNIIIILVLIGIMIIIIIILTGGVIWDTCQMILRKKSHLLLMER